MSKAKLAITLDTRTLERLDRLVETKRFANRSRVIQDAVEEKLQRIEKTRLARECAKVDLREQRELTEEGMAMELENWPKY